METVKYEKIVHSSQIPAMITILRKEEIHHFFRMIFLFLHIGTEALKYH